MATPTSLPTVTKQPAQKDVFAQLVERIVAEQENIIGPLAIEQAQKVPGLKIDWATHNIALQGDKKQIIEGLVKQYEYLFGQTSVEVCKEAASALMGQIPTNQVPDLIRS